MASVNAPLMYKVQLRYDENSVEYLTQNYFLQYFNGSEIIVAGKLKNDPLSISTNVIGVNDIDEEINFAKEFTYVQVRRLHKFLRICRPVCTWAKSFKWLVLLY